MTQKKWSKEIILGMIKDLKNQNVDLSAGYISKKHIALFAAASSGLYFGGWENAVEMAGFDYDQIMREGKTRRQAKLTKWSRVRILEEIKKEPSLNLLTAYKDKRDLYSAACREFNSWKEALAAAGYHMIQDHIGGSSAIIESEGPVTEVQTLVSGAMKNFHPPKSGGNSILVADDDKAFHFLILKAMKANGVENPIHFVEDGLELVEHLNKNLEASLREETRDFPCLILMDLHMPQMDGHEAFKTVKSKDTLREIPVVVLSNFCDPKDIDNSYKEGASSFFAKPLNFRELVGLMGLLKTYWLKNAKLPFEGG